MARIKVERLHRLREIEERLAEVAAETAADREEMKQILAEAKEDLESTGNSKAKRGPFLLVFEETSGRVSWKKEFVRVEGAAAAAKLAKDAPKNQALKVVDAA